MGALGNRSVPALTRITASAAPSHPFRFFATGGWEALSVSVKNGLSPAAPGDCVSQISQAPMPSLLHPLNLPNPAACANPDLSPNSGPPPSGRPPWLRLLGSALGTCELPTPPVTLSPERTPEGWISLMIYWRNIAEEPGCKSVVCHWRQLLLRAEPVRDDSPTPGCSRGPGARASLPSYRQ